MLVRWEGRARREVDTRAWRASRPVMLRSWRWRSVRVVPGPAASATCATMAPATSSMAPPGRSVGAMAWLSPLSAHRLECGPQFIDENPGLLPRGEMAALGDAVVMDQLRVGPLRPAARRLILLAREDGHRDRDLDALGVEEAALILPVEPRRGHARVGQPVERDVVEDLVARQFAGRARGSPQPGGDRRRRLGIGVIMIEQPGGEERRANPQGRTRSADATP